MLQRCLWLVLSACLLTSALSAQNAPLYFPPLTGNTWATTAPSSLGFCLERIDSLYQFLESRNTKSFILLKDGRIVLEKYFGTFVQDSIWYWASAGKSLTAFLVGQAQDEGLLDINDPTSEYLGTGWTTCTPEQEAAITLWHQLTMTNGLEDNVPDDNCTDPECLFFKAPAGTRWAYHNAPYHLLHDVIAAASGQTIQQFTKTRLLDRTGMKGFWFDHIQYGRARDMARFGLLTLAHGVWNGDTLLHNADYYQAMTTSSQALNPSYGYLWWLNGQSGYQLPGVQFVFPGPLATNAPPDMFAALGKNDQKIHVVPSKGWVVVRQGNDAGGPGGLVPIVFDNQMWGYLNALTCTSTATQETDAAEWVQVAPTVTQARSGTWSIQATTPLRHVSVLNAQGTVLQQADTPAGTSSFLLKINDLPSGAYVLQLTFQNGRTVAKRVVVN